MNKKSVFGGARLDAAGEGDRVSVNVNVGTPDRNQLELRSMQ